MQSSSSDDVAKTAEPPPNPNQAASAPPSSGARAGDSSAGGSRGGPAGPELHYNEPSGAAGGDARSRFREGDVLLFRGKGLFSHGIRWITDSRYSHAGLTHIYEGRVYCLEAVGSGVRLVLMSVLVDHYEGGIDYFQHVAATEAQRKKAIEFAFPQLGKLYDKPGIARFFWALVTKHMEPLRRDELWYCSELVAAAYHEAGAPLLADEHPEAYVSPADLAGSAQLRHLFCVKK